jgi:hypothetical protein
VLEKERVTQIKLSQRQSCLLSSVQLKTMMKMQRKQDKEVQAESDEEYDDIADVVGRWLTAINAMAPEDDERTDDIDQQRYFD